jgi:hypothetical protein
MSVLGLPLHRGPAEAAKPAAAAPLGAGSRDGCAPSAGAPLAAARGVTLGAFVQHLKHTSHVAEDKIALGATAAGGAARSGLPARRAGRHDSATSLHAPPSTVSPQTTDDEVAEDQLCAQRAQRLRPDAAPTPPSSAPRIVAMALSVKVSALPASFEVFAPQLMAIVASAVRAHGAALAGTEPAAVQARLGCAR